MLRLCRLAAALIVLFALLLIGLRWIGSFRPLASADLLDAILSNPDGSPCKHPCIFGVRVGSRFDDAVASLKLHPFVKTILVDHAKIYSNKESMFFSVSNASINIDLYGNVEDQASVSTVYIHSLYARQLTLGEVFERFGMPDDIDAISVVMGQYNTVVGTNIYLKYPTQGLQFGLFYGLPTQAQAKTIIRPDNRIESISLILPEDLRQCNPFQCQKWEGFKSVESYQQLPPPRN